MSAFPFSTSSYKRWDRVWVKVKEVKMILRRSEDDRMNTGEQRRIREGGIAPQNKVKRRLSQNNYPFTSEERNEWWGKWTKRTRNEERINKGRKKEAALTSQTTDRATAQQPRWEGFEIKISGWGLDVKMVAKCSGDYLKHRQEECPRVPNGVVWSKRLSRQGRLWPEHTVGSVMKGLIEQT